MIIKNKETGEVIGKVITNQSMSFDEAMELAGFEWKTLEKDGVECNGWYDADGVLWDESVTEIEGE